MISKVRKKLIEECVWFYRKKYPVEYMAVCESVRRHRKGLANKHGSIMPHQKADENAPMIRWTLKIPERLFTLLETVVRNPRFLETDEEILWFKKRFPEFRIVDKL